MVQQTPGEMPELPVEQLARFLLRCAQEDPALLARSNIGPPLGQRATPRTVPVAFREGPSRLPAARLGGDRQARENPEMEELVSIAVACARRAEDALQHARDVSNSARRRMSMVAVVTGCGVLAAAAAIVLDRHHVSIDPAFTEVAAAVRGVTDLQRKTVDQLDAVRSDVAALRDGDVADVPAGASSATSNVTRSADVPAAAPPASSVTPAVASTSPTPTVTQAAVVPAPQPPGDTPADTPVARGPDPLPPLLPPALAAAQPAAPVVAATDPGQADEPNVSPDDAATTDLALIDPPPAPPEDAHPALPGPPARAVRHVYRARYYRPVRPATYYRPSPPMLLAQVVANVRRNIYSIFH